MGNHRIEVTFGRKEKISSISIYSDIGLDESFTPKHIRVYAKTSNYCNELIFEKKFSDTMYFAPHGWIDIQLGPHSKQLLHCNRKKKSSDSAVNKPDKKKKKLNHKKVKTPKYLKTDKIVLEIKESYEYGRDIHIRQMRIWAPINSKCNKKAIKSATNLNYINQFLPNHRMPQPSIFCIQVPKNIINQTRDNYERLGLLVKKSNIRANDYKNAILNYVINNFHSNCINDESWNPETLIFLRKYFK